VYLVMGYFCIGIWHIVSMLVHVFNKSFVRSKLIRNSYYVSVVLMISTLKYFMEFNVIYLAPIMAIFYTALCGFEVFAKVERPLDQLK
jgi:hypothetical protein